MEQHLEKALLLILKSDYIVTGASRRSLETCLQSMIGHAGVRMIMGLPYQASRALLPEWSIDERDVLTCTAIGIAGWAAWTAADRIRDGQNGTKDSHADLYAFSILRPIVEKLVRNLNLSDAHNGRIIRTIGTMEYADSPDSTLDTRQRSIWKSMGAAIPLLALLMKAGIDEEDTASCQAFFHHLILARQLSDDALDWREDGGFIGTTPVIELLERCFDERIKYDIAAEMRDEADRAIAEAHDMRCFEDTSFLKAIPIHYKKMADSIISSSPSLPSSSPSAHLSRPYDRRSSRTLSPVRAASRA